jgi:hypothetical protein
MPHHISVYYQALATYDPTLPATKILPSSGLVRGNIPGYATSVTIAYDTGITYEYQVQAWVDGANYILRGNRMASLYPNAQIVPYPAGGVAQTITASAYGVQNIDEGENSFITVSSPTGGTTNIDFMAGPFCPKRGSIDYLYEPTIFFNYPDIHVEQSEKSGIDILSIPYQKSVIGGNFSGTLHVTNVMGSTYSGTLGPDAGVNKNDARYACYYLQKWRDAGIPLMFFVEQLGSDYDVNYPHIWYGQLIDVPHMGLHDAQDDNEISFTAKINYIQPNTYDLGWWKVAAKDTGANTISINGDHTAQIIAGAKIRTVGSTADNGLWAVATSVYTGGNTVITVTGDITDGTADGRVELWLRR